MFVRRATFILALTLGLVPSAGAQLQLSATVTDVTERQTATLAIRLVNTGASTRELQPQLALPAGWVTLVPPRSLTLAPGEATVEVVVVRVPRSAGAGIHPVSVTVDGVSTDAAVRVAHRDAVSLRALSADVTNGEALATFQLRNDGNAPTSVNLTAVGQGRPRVTPATLTLAPGQTGNVQVTGSVPSEVAKYSVTLRARTPGATAQASVSADVLTPAPAAGSAWHTLPAEVQVETGHAGTRIRLSTQGAVAPGVNVRLRAEPGVLEAEVRTPGVLLALGQATPGFSSFGVRPPALALHGEFGDSTVSSSTLRGYVGLRRDLQGQAVAGLQLARRYGWGEARVGVDLSSGGATATIAARAATPRVTAQGELGVRSDGIALALNADATLDDNPMKLSRAGGSVRYRAPDFDGTSSGRVDLEVRTVAQLHEFSVGGSLRGGVELAAGHALAARDAEFGIRAQTARLKLQAGLKWSEHFDRQANTVTASFGASHAVGQGRLEQEVTSERAAQASTPVTNKLRYAVLLDYPFGDERNTFRLRPSAEVTFDLLSGRSRVGAGIDGRWSGEKGTRVSASVSQPDFSQRALHLSAGIEHPLANGSVLIASLSQSFGAVSSTAVRVAARLPLALPLYVRPDMGSLEGRVLNHQGEGVAGVTVQVMSYLAVTDAQGTYHFPALPQGEQLAVLRVPEGQWCTPPGTVAVQGRQVTRHDLRCVPSAQTTARMVVHTVGESTEAPLEVAGVLVTLKGPLGTFRATSDMSGRLIFGDLPAGTYGLEVTPATPAQFRTLITEMPRTVDLAPGPVDLTFLFGRRPRVVQMQDEQPIVVPMPSPPAATPSGAP